MRSILILSLILAFTITNAQDRKDTIRMKDGAEILCQILKVSKPDSIIQFCIRENGELKVKKVQTAYVASYAWPGKDQADTYSKMLGVKSIQQGEIYNAYGYKEPTAENYQITNADMVAKSLKKANRRLITGIALTAEGLVTALIIPKCLKDPDISNNYIYSFQEYESYHNTVDALKYIGFGIATAGVIIGLASIPQFRKAELFKLQSGNELSISQSRDGLCIVFKF